jgi:hypothetical protein
MTDDPIISHLPEFITAGGTVMLFDRRTRLSDCLRPHSVPGYDQAEIISGSASGFFLMAAQDGKTAILNVVLSR